MAGPRQIVGSKIAIADHLRALQREHADRLPGLNIIRPTLDGLVIMHVNQQVIIVLAVSLRGSDRTKFANSSLSSARIDRNFTGMAVSLGVSRRTSHISLAQIMHYLTLRASPRFAFVCIAKAGTLAMDYRATVTNVSLILFANQVSLYFSTNAEYS